MKAVVLRIINDCASCALNETRIFNFNILYADIICVRETGIIILNTYLKMYVYMYVLLAIQVKCIYNIIKFCIINA